MQEIKLGSRPVPPEDRSMPPVPHRKGSSVAVIIALLLIILIALLVFVGWNFKENSTANLSQDSFYAAFLTNGQVYFGKVEKKTRDELILNTVYYLQLNDAEILPNNASTSAVTEPRFNLVKLGQELHGPTDRLVINIDHLMFYEELKGDSAVVQSIRNQGQL